MIATPGKRAIAIYAYYYSRAGQRQEKKKDAAASSGNIHYQIFSLADGGSGGAAAIGAKIAVMKSCAFLLRLGAKAYRFASRKTGELLTEEVLYHLRRRSARDYRPLNTYGSTLTVCLADRREPPAVLLCQLGNSGVLLCSAHSCIRLPGGRDPACRTTSRGAGGAMDVRQVNLQPDQHLCLGSDGFLALFQNPCYGPALREALCHKNYGAMRQILDDAKPEDDATFLMLTQQPIGGEYHGRQ